MEPNLQNVYGVMSGSTFLPLVNNEAFQSPNSHSVFNFAWRLVFSCIDPFFFAEYVPCQKEEGKISVKTPVETEKRLVSS